MLPKKIGNKVTRDLLKHYQYHSDHPNEDETDRDSVTGDVGKLSVLDMVDALEDNDRDGSGASYTFAALR